MEKETKGGSTLRNVIIPVIVGVLTLFVSFYGGTRMSYRNFESREKLLENQKDSLDKQISSLHIQCDELSKENQILQQKITTIRDSVKTIKLKYDEKINTVRTYSNSELERFFAERYN